MIPRKPKPLPANPEPMIPAPKRHSTTASNKFSCGDVRGLFEYIKHLNMSNVWVDMRAVGTVGAIVELTPKENGNILAVKAEKFRVTIERIED